MCDFKSNYDLIFLLLFLTQKLNFFNDLTIMIDILKNIYTDGVYELNI